MLLESTDGLRERLDEEVEGESLDVVPEGEGGVPLLKVNDVIKTQLPLFIYLNYTIFKIIYKQKIKFYFYWYRFLCY
jgi:hypothetical protein